MAFPKRIFIEEEADTFKSIKDAIKSVPIDDTGIVAEYALVRKGKIVKGEVVWPKETKGD